MTVTNKDYYGLLGLGRDADERAIKAAFRSQARRYHPDLNGGDPTAERLFKDLDEAYKTLSDPARRRDYDALRASPRAAVPGPLRSFWQEERQLCVSIVGWLRGQGARLGYGAGVAVIIVGLLLIVGVRHGDGARQPTSPGVADTAALTHPRTTVMTRPREATPLGTVGSGHGDSTRPPARGARRHVAAPRPLYLYGACVRFCSPTHQPASG